MAIFRSPKRPGKWIAKFRDGAGVQVWREFVTMREATDFQDRERPRARQRTARSTVSRRISAHDYATTLWLPEVDARPGLSLSTKFSYRNVMEKIWLPKIGPRQLRELEEADLVDVLLEHLNGATGITKKAPNTARLYIATLTKMLRHAIRKHHLLADNPAAALAEELGIQRETRVSEEIFAFDRPERDRFLATARVLTPDYWPIFFLLAHTGLRPSEGRALHWIDYDPARLVLKIRHNFGRRDTLGVPKTRYSRRDVDVTPHVAELLRRLRTAQAEAKLAHGWPEMPAYVFTEPEGGPLARRTFERAFERVLVKAGLGQHHSPKSLRHTFASILISESQGAKLVYVSKQLGHASIAITERTYFHYIPAPTPGVHALDAVENPWAGQSGSKMAGSGSSDQARSSNPTRSYAHGAV
jgi:integrase